MTIHGLPTLLTAVTQTVKNAVSPQAEQKTSDAPRPKAPAMPRSPVPFVGNKYEKAGAGALGGIAAAVLQKQGKGPRLPAPMTTLTVGLSPEVKHQQLQAWFSGSSEGAKSGALGSMTLGGVPDSEK